MTNEAYNLLIKILTDRAERHSDPDTRSTYRSVLTMVEYANEDNLECLRQFDYYGEEE